MMIDGDDRDQVNRAIPITVNQRSRHGTYGHCLKKHTLLPSKRDNRKVYI